MTALDVKWEIQNSDCMIFKELLKYVILKQLHKAAKLTGEMALRVHSSNSLLSLERGGGGIER